MIPPVAQPMMKIAVTIPPIFLGTERRASQLIQSWTASQVEQLLVHRVEEPAKGSHDENEPVISVQLAIPGDTVAGKEEAEETSEGCMAARIVRWGSFRILYLI